LAHRRRARAQAQRSGVPRTLHRAAARAAPGRIALVSAPLYRRIGNAALLVVLSLVCGFFAAGVNRWYEGMDFHCFWAAGRIVASGGDPYDAQQFVLAILTIPPSEARSLIRCGQRLSYPPWTD